MNLVAPGLCKPAAKNVGAGDTAPAAIHAGAQVNRSGFSCPIVDRRRVSHYYSAMAKTTRLCTFGYEGLTIDAFMARLKESGVRTIIDVRELPLSRKRGFSKKAFAEALHRSGIAYAHMPALGCPKPIRDAYRTDGDWAAYTRRFLAYLREQEDAIAELAKIAGSTSACLVCYEADFNFCHRSMVARAVSRAGGPPVIHLSAKTGISELSMKAAA